MFILSKVCIRFHLVNINFDFVSFAMLIRFGQVSPFVSHNEEKKTIWKTVST